MLSAQTKIDTFFKQFPTITYPSNYACLSAGKTSDFFYFIETGAVKMTHLSAEGKNLILHIFFPKSFFSLLTLIGSGVNQYDFITLQTTTLRRVPKTELVAFLQQHNDVLYDLQLRLLKGLEGLLKRLEKTALTPAYNQVASLLLYFSSHFASPETKNQITKLNIKITHQEIADWLGLSRENVSIQMKLLERNKLIKILEHHIELLDRSQLQKVADQGDVL